MTGALLDWATVVLVAAGAGFFVAGTVGLLRFPDTHSRLHALTKADNLGLGLVVFGLALQGGGAAHAGKLVLVWALALVAAASTAQLIARAALLPDAPRPEELPTATNGKGAP
jgi:multicomponent Na+:H+ antiporter subunit G